MTNPDAWNPSAMDAADTSIPTDDMFLTTTPSTDPYDCDVPEDLSRQLPSNEPTASNDPDCSLLAYMVDQQEEDEIIDTTRDALPACGSCEEDTEILTNIFYPGCTFQEVEPVLYPVGADGLNVPPLLSIDNQANDSPSMLTPDPSTRAAAAIAIAAKPILTNLAKKAGIAIAQKIGQTAATAFVDKYLSDTIIGSLFGSGSGPSPQEIIKEAVEQSKAYTDQAITQAITNLVIQNTAAEMKGMEATVKAFLNTIRGRQAYPEALLEYGKELCQTNRSDSSRPVVDCENLRLTHATRNKKTRTVQTSNGTVIANTNLLLTNRIATIRAQGYAIVLLPIFTACANIHISFLYDVIRNAQELNLTQAEIDTFRRLLRDCIIDYSNHCISTYKTKFDELYNKKVPQHELLSFRNTMVLEVLDQVSLWSFLKFSNFSIRSSMNLYVASPLMKVSEQGVITINPRPSINSWSLVNQILQGIPNKVLAGYNGSGYTYNIGNVIIRDGLNRLQTTYVGGRQSGSIGRLISGTQSFFGAAIYNTDFSYNLPIEQAVTFPWTKVYLGDTGLGTKKSPNVTTLGDTNQYYPIYPNANNTAMFQSGVLNSTKIELPDWRVTNLSGIPPIGPLSNRTIGDAWRDIVNITDSPDEGLGVPVVVMTRPNISRATVTPKGDIIHVLPTDAAGKPMGFNIPVLQYSDVGVFPYRYDTTWKISEHFANNGDAILFTESTAGLTYNVQSFARHAVQYRITLKVKARFDYNPTTINLEVLDPSVGSSIFKKQFVIDNGTPSYYINDNGYNFNWLTTDNSVLILANSNANGVVTRQIKITFDNATNVRLAGIYLSRADSPILDI